MTLSFVVFSQTDEWRLSEVNKDFSVCPSYPSLLTVPKDIDDESLCKAASFRHGGRFPVLSYYHKKNGMVRRSALWKCCFQMLTCLIQTLLTLFTGDDASSTATNRNQWTPLQRGRETDQCHTLRREARLHHRHAGYSCGAAG